MMIKFRITGILLIIQIFCFSVYGQNVEISGNAPAYKGEKLEFFLSKNPIIPVDELVGECVVDNDGNFLCKINIEQICRVYIPLGIYRGYFYATPGNMYNLLLPPLKKNTIEQDLNPYFKETPIHAGVINEGRKGLNFLVQQFDELFYPLLESVAINRYSRKTSDFNSLPDKLNSLDDSTGIPFYINYKKYNIELLRIISSGFSAKQRKLFSKIRLPLNYNNPSCVALINQVFNNYFSNLGRTADGKMINACINRTGNYSRLLEIVRDDLSVSSDSLPELLIMKSINEVFYQKKYSERGLLGMLDSLLVNTKIPAHKIFAKQIYEDITRLRKGYTAPPFALKNMADSITGLNEFNGKYVYLGFCSTRSYPCMRQFRLLNELPEKSGEDLEIVIVMVGENSSEVKKFTKYYGFEGEVLSAETGDELLKQYKIKSYPTYYLIGRDGKFLLSPAPSPEENFESVFQKILDFEPASGTRPQAPGTR